MALIEFATGDASATSVSWTVERNPTYPRDVPIAAPASIVYRAADGTPYVFEVGKRADLELTWTDECPMTADDFASLQEFWLAVRGCQDLFDYTDEDGETHAARFTDPGAPDSWTQHPHGFAGTLALRIST